MCYHESFKTKNFTDKDHTVDSWAQTNNQTNKKSQKKKKKCPKEVTSAKGTPKTKFGKRKDREKQRLGGQLWG